MAGTGAIRRSRTRKAQFLIYVEHLERFSILRTGKFTPSTNPQDLEKLWISLKDKLNSCGDGPTRDVDGWIKVFTEWKSQMRKKARENKLLNDIEARILEQLGWWL